LLTEPTTTSWGIAGTILIVLYLASAIYVVGYGLHLYVLMALFARRHRRVTAAQLARIAAYAQRASETEWPRVTSQIPLYNEANVAKRVIEAVARLDYPAHRHEIQVLDDSTDDTRRIVDATVACLATRGIDIRVVRRPDRHGYKAGALAYGLARAKGAFIAIFDADFVPHGDFLRRAVPLLTDTPKNACVQGRWGHLNALDSWLTRAQSLAIDGHFAVEQGGRCWNGFLLNFNGTAGLWRRAAIDDPAVGGWTADTLTEDLDLSYRAQLAGWRIEYCMDLECPAELPDTIPALKAQQFRWAKGSIQCARKLLRPVWTSGLPLSKKLEATIHLTAYSIAVWMLLLGLLSVPLAAMNSQALLGNWLYALWTMMFIALTGPPVAYAYSRRSITDTWRGIASALSLMVLGAGLCLSNTVAFVAGLYQGGGEFVRTPKRGNRSNGLTYRARGSGIWCLEFVAAAYCTFSYVQFILAGNPFGGAFLLIYAAGFFVVGWQSMPKPADKPAPQPRPAVNHLPARLDEPGAALPGPHMTPVASGVDD